MFKKNDIVIVTASHEESWLRGCILRLTDVEPRHEWIYYGICIKTNKKMKVSDEITPWYPTQTIGTVYHFPPSSLELVRN